MLTTSLKNSIKSFFSSSWGNLILSAFTGALVSLATTTYLDNKNREITLRPYVNVDFSANRENPESPQLGIVIDNLGKGPAIIENSTFYINNKRYPIKNEDFSKIMSEIISELNLDVCIPFFTIDITPREKIAIGENKSLNFLTIPEQSYNLQFKKLKGDLLIMSKFTNNKKTEAQVEQDFEFELYKSIMNYQVCRDNFIKRFHDKNYNIAMEINYKSLNEDKSYGENILMPIKTSPPLIQPQ